MINKYNKICVILVNTLMLCFGNKINEDLNVNDILRTDLMPNFFIMDENTKEDAYFTKNYQLPRVNGSIDTALSILDYHRKMMNEYHCRHYVAQQLAEEMGNRVLRNRIGDFEVSNSFGIIPSRRSQDVRNDLMYDPGSNNYQAWLAKVFNNINQNYNTTSPNSPNNMSLYTPSLKSQAQSRNGAERYEVVEQNESGYGQSESGYGQSESNISDMSKYESGYEYSMQPPPPGHHPTFEVREEKEEYSVGHDHHGLGIAELFDISLTGIAFLSFGMFVLQVLMCITMNHQEPQLMQIMSNRDTVHVDDVFRFKRDNMHAEDVFKRDTEYYKTLNSVNNLVRYALMAVKEQPIVCLYRSLCLGTKHARESKDKNRYWLPLWHAGVGWVKGNVLASLQAIVLGLGGVDCNEMYPTSLCINSK